MDMKAGRLVRHLQREVESRVGDMTERELATVAWSFASLRHNPGAVLDLLAEAATPKLAAFEPKVSFSRFGQNVLCLPLPALSLGFQ